MPNAAKVSVVGTTRLPDTASATLEDLQRKLSFELESLGQASAVERTLAWGGTLRRLVFHVQALCAHAAYVRKVEASKKVWLFLPIQLIGGR